MRSLRSRLDQLVGAGIAICRGIYGQIAAHNTIRKTPNWGSDPANGTELSLFSALLTSRNRLNASFQGSDTAIQTKMPYPQFRRHHWQPPL
jgi:hypothetical protein